MPMLHAELGRRPIEINIKKPNDWLLVITLNGKETKLS